MKSLIEQLSISLATEDNEARRKEWAQFILDNNVKLKDLVTILDAERKAAMRFTWLVGDLCERKPEAVFPAIPHFYAKKDAMPFPNFDRSLAKMFWLCGVPEQIEGEAINDLFKWVLDPKVTVTTKTYAMEALCKLVSKHEGLRNELKLVIEDQLDKNTETFNKRALKMLEKL
jgi:hypothetical protein